MLLGVGGAIFSSLDWALADARNSLDPAAAQALNVLSNDLFWPFQAGLAVFSIGIGLAIVSILVFLRSASPLDRPAGESASLSGQEA